MKIKLPQPKATRELYCQNIEMWRGPIRRNALMEMPIHMRNDNHRLPFDANQVIRRFTSLNDKTQHQVTKLVGLVVIECPQFIHY
jgi:hypothetical protein